MAPIIPTNAPYTLSRLFEKLHHRCSNPNDQIRRICTKSIHRATISGFVHTYRALQNRWVFIIRGNVSYTTNESYAHLNGYVALIFTSETERADEVSAVIKKARKSTDLNISSEEKQELRDTFRRLSAESILDNESNPDGFDDEDIVEWMCDTPPNDDVDVSSTVSPRSECQEYQVLNSDDDNPSDDEIDEEKIQSLVLGYFTSAPRRVPSKNNERYEWSFTLIDVLLTNVPTSQKGITKDVALESVHVSVVF